LTISQGEFKALTHAGPEKYELPLSVIEDATREQDLRKKAFLYYRDFNGLARREGYNQFIKKNL
jgi:hypothetical protein